jgi:hypothetical protein
MTCAGIAPKLGEFLVGALDPADDETVLRHLEQCDVCARELGALGSIENGLRASARRRPVRMGPKIAIAAAGLAAAILVAFASALSRPASPTLRSGAIASASSVHLPGDALPLNEALSALAAARVDLARGHRFEPTEGTRFSLAEGALSMETGEANVQAAGDHDLSVRTPLGVIEGRGASFRVSIEEPSMNRPVVAASGLVVTVAVIGGAVLFTDRDRSTRIAAPDELVVGPGATAAGRPASLPVVHAGSAGEVLELREQVAALTRERDSMQAKLAAQVRSIAALEETNRRLTEAADPLGTKERAEDVELATAIKDQKKTAIELADLLGLDEARQKDFDAKYQDIRNRVKDLEVQKAKVTVDGDTTTITIPPFEEDGKALTREWDDWIARNLAPDEQRRYAKHEMFRNLYDEGIGVWDRQITIRPEGADIFIEDRVRRVGQQGWEGVTSSRTNHVQEALAPYRHLIGNR